MQKGHTLHFNCLRCSEPINFSIFALNGSSGTLTCSSCSEVYSFQDENLLRQLKKFENLCKQIVEAEEILSDISVGVNIGEQVVRVPYKILLARMSSTLNLTVGNTPLAIDFRMEPLADLPKKFDEEQKPIEHKKIPLKFTVDE